MKPRLKLLAVLAVGAVCIFAAYRTGRRTASVPPARPSEVTLPSEALAYTGVSIPAQTGQLFGALEFNRDGSLLAAQTPKGISVLDSKTGAAVFSADKPSATREEMQEKQAVFAFLHSKDSLLLCQSSGMLTLLDMTGGDKPASFRIESDWIRGMSVRPDDSEVLLAEDNGSLTILSLKDGSARTLKGPTEMSVAEAATYSPDGSRIASAWTEGRILLHDRTGGTLLSSAGWPHGEVTRLEFTPDGGRLAVASGDGKVYLLDTGSGTEIDTGEKALLLSGRFALVEKEGGKTELRDFSANTRENGPSPEMPLLAAAISPFGSALALQSAGGITIEHIKPPEKPFIFPKYSGKSPEEEREYYLLRARADAAMESFRNPENSEFGFTFPVSTVNYNPASAAFEFEVLGERLEAAADFRQAADFARASREPALYGTLRPNGAAYELSHPVLRDRNGGPSLPVRPSVMEPLPAIPPAPQIPGRRQRAYETASRLYSAGQRNKALELLGALSRDKYPPAMTTLAFLYSSKTVPGMGDEEALKLELAAAGYGDTRALIRMGERMLYGVGVSSDAARAMDYFREAAQGGSPEAAYWLGSALALQEGVPIGQTLSGPPPLTENMLLAAKWLRKSAEGGYARGQLAYGEILENGIGAAPDQDSALEWYARAGRQGLTEAVIRQARLLEARARTPGEKEQALRLLVQAAKSDRTRESSLREFLSRQKPEELRAIFAIPRQRQVPGPGKLVEKLLPAPKEFFTAPPPKRSMISSAVAAAAALTVALLLAASAAFAARKLPSCPRGFERRCAMSAMRLIKKVAAAAAETAKSATAEMTPEDEKDNAKPDSDAGGKGDGKKDKPDDKDDTVLKISL